jgi:hypothetical protein
MLETQRTPKDGNGGSGLQDPHSMTKARLLQAQSQLGGARRPSENRLKPMSHCAFIGGWDRSNSAV